MDYRYEESGLDNVIIVGMNIIQDDHGEDVFNIPNVIGLHKTIAEGIVNHAHSISPKELRFLRTEMGLTQNELAEVVKKDHQTIGRWERGEVPIDETAEMIVRLLAAERLKVTLEVEMAELARRCVPSAMLQMLTIDGSDPSAYTLMAA